MNSDRSTNILDDIQTLCKDYRRKLKRGETPRLEDYLSSIGESSRDMLFQNLLHIDIEFRRRKGEAPTSEEYIERFPQFGRLIRQAFFESTMMSMDDEAATPAVDETIVLGVPAARKLGEYELLRELGRGGFGVVYAAKHLKRGEVVALKTLPMGLAGSSHGADDAERLHKFRQEFRQLSEVNHPNLVGMQTLEVEGNQWFLTMDLVDGSDFLEYVRPNNQVDEERLRSVLKQLVAGIVALHERGIVHRDLKPSNVLVSKDGRVTILDFGLVAELQQPTGRTVSMQSQNFAGTPRYAAPEQAAGTRGAAGDWYALGVMLYEAFTGEAPFRGTGMQVIVKKQTEDAPQLADRAGVSEDLATLVDQLLQREAHARPDSATICEVVGVEDETISHGSSDDSESHGSTLDEVLLIGRDKQLAKLEQAKQTLLASRQPAVMFVSGLSGEGKSSLIEKFLQPLRRDDKLLVLSGRCYDRESVPFKAIDVLIDALAAYLRSRPHAEANSKLPRDIPMLAHLFPTLRRVATIAERCDVETLRVDDRQVRYRAFFALKELLVAISRDTPIVGFVDDLQWGDADSAEVLADLLSSDVAPSLLLLGSYRSDEAERSPFLQGWRQHLDESGAHLPQRHVQVEPLTEDECLEFLAQRTRLSREELESQVHGTFAATKGNPYFLEQLIEGFDATTRQFVTVPLRDVIVRKLAQLPDGATDILRAVAIAGQPISTEEAGQVAGCDAHYFSTITHMRSERLIRIHGDFGQETIDTYHDKIRETVLDELGENERRNWHVRYGEWLEAQESTTTAAINRYLELDPATTDAPPTTTDRIFDLAHHFSAASDSRAFAYQLMAGELSFRAYASEDAIAFLKRAAELKPEKLSPTVEYRLWQRFGASLSRAKRFEEALSIYERAIESACSPFGIAAAHMGVANVNQTVGRYTVATASYDKALQALGMSRPTGIAVWLGTLSMACQILALSTGILRWMHGRQETKLCSFEHSIYKGIFGYMFEQRDGAIDYLYAGLRSGMAAIAEGTPETVASGLGDVALLLAINGLPGLGGHVLRRRDALGANSADAEVQGCWLLQSAIVHANRREFRAAHDEFKRSRPLLEKSGSHFWHKYASHLDRHLKAIDASSTEELEVARLVLRTAIAAGDIQGQFMGHYDIAGALARKGDTSVAIIRVREAQNCLQQGEMNLTEAIFLGTVGFVKLQSSDYLGARQALEKSWELTLERKLAMEYVVRTLPFLIESIAGPRWLTEQDANERRHLRKLCRWAAIAYYLYPNMRSPIERARGRAFWVLGKQRKAQRCFERAVQRARELNIKYDLARSLLDRAAVVEKDREESRREAIELLKQQESVIPAAERWLLGDCCDEAVLAPAPQPHDNDTVLTEDEVSHGKQ